MQEELQLNISPTSVGPNPCDVVMTPFSIAGAIITHFKPSGNLLDPCKGSGAFFDQMPPEKDWCEVALGKDFYLYERKVDWIISNPPYSDFDNWLAHSFDIALNVVYLTPFAKVFKSWGIMCRIFEYGGIKEIVNVGPGNRVGFPFGFPCAAFQFVKGYKGPTQISILEKIGAQ